MGIRHDIGRRAMAGAFAAAGLCAAPLAAHAAPAQMKSGTVDIRGATEATTVTTETLSPPVSGNVSAGSAAASVGHVGLDISGVNSGEPSEMFPRGARQSSIQITAGNLVPQVSGGPLGGDCLGCSTIGGGSGGGGSGGVVIAPSTPPIQPASLPVCKAGEQLVVLAGTPRCV